MTAGIVLVPAVYLVGDLMDRLSVCRIYASIFCSVADDVLCTGSVLCVKRL